jgi:spermidine dehydrogenase
MKRIHRKLGEDRRIPRRDFVQGVLAGAATALTGPLLAPPALAATETLAGEIAPQDRRGYYPPRLTGLRGSHPGSFEAAHAVRDGASISDEIDTGESYDLIVIGAGISGLSAAHFYRAQHSGASRILILDNHDDFGGHAKRNEFDLAGHLELMNGGTLGIDSPRPYSPVAEGLLRELGIDVHALSQECEDHEFYPHLGLMQGAFFDRETFGADRLVVGRGKLPVKTWTGAAPLSDRAKQDIERIEEGETDYLPDVPAPEKKLRLSRISYSDFLRDLVGVDPSVLAFYQAITHGEWGVGIDAISALDGWAFGLPGFKGLNLPKGSIERMGYTPSGYHETGGSARFHFPDGNASIARLLVRSLVPAAVPGSTAKDVVTARIDYSRLDRAADPVRIRLSSTAARVRNLGDLSHPEGVEVSYLRNARAYRVRARNCVLACYNMMIPYLCPELPDTQKAALHKLVKTPLVYTTVALRNWHSFKKLGVYQVYAPGCYMSGFGLNPKVNIGRYRSITDPSQPILIRMLRTPCKPGLSEHEQNKVGRAELLGTPFVTFEQNIRNQLARTLGPGGFDPARDIQAITVNRWPHGYAPEYNPLWDPEVPPDQRWNVIGRQRFGRITIANSDSGMAAYTDSAIDQASRAVAELLAV